MDFLHNFGSRRRKFILSTRRRMNVLSALNSPESKKYLCPDKDSENHQQNNSDHGKEIMAFLQVGQFHVERLQELKKCLLHSVLKESIEPLDDIIGLVDEMLSAHSDIISILICEKSNISNALNHLSSCLDVYISYSLLINLEKDSFQKTIELHRSMCMDIDLLHEPITYITRCEALFQKLCSVVPEEIYYNASKAIETTLNSIQNELAIRENSIKTLQIQRILFNREPKILSPGRIFIKKGILYKINHKGNGMKKRVFFLFNDILISCKSLSKTVDWEKKDSLLFCALFPLNMCNVSLIMGSSNQGALFKVTCGTISYLLISRIPGDGQSWVTELQVAIRSFQKPNGELKPKLNRRKNTGLKHRISPFLKQTARLSKIDYDTKKTKENATDLQYDSSNTSLAKVITISDCVNV